MQKERLPTETIKLVYQETKESEIIRKYLLFLYKSYFVFLLLSPNFNYLYLKVIDSLTHKLGNLEAQNMGLTS